MSHIFISYSKQDITFARHLRQLLEAQGFAVWMDEKGLEPSGDWWNTIMYNIRTSAAVIVIMSRRSEGSRWVRREILYAESEDVNRPVFPVLMDGRIWAMLADIESVEMREGLRASLPPRLLHKLKEVVPSSSGRTSTLPMVPGPPITRARFAPVRRSSSCLIGVTLAVIIAAGVILALGLDLLKGNDPTRTPTAQLEAGHPGAGSTPTVTPTPEPVIPTHTPDSPTLGARVNDPTPPTPIPPGSPNTAWTPVLTTYKDMPFVYVPAGCFVMGSTSEQVDEAMAFCKQSRQDCDPAWFQDEAPAHEVCLSAFWLAQTEITNAQYAACVRAGACTPPSQRTFFDDDLYADHPVVYVDWHQAQAYAAWLGGSVPTEAQWEYAARGPESWEFPWGNQHDPLRYNFCDTNCLYEWRDATYNDGYAQTSRVNAYPGGASWVGALDMAGNVNEWVADWYGPYALLPNQDPPGPSNGTYRAGRGSSWGALSFRARAAFRTLEYPGFAEANHGFRITLPPALLAD